MSPRTNASKPAVDIEARRRQITDQIATLGPTLPGSLVTRSSRCGNRGCRCQHDPAHRHGPYWTWTRSINGKTVTRALSNEQAEIYRPWFDNTRQLRNLVDELKHLALEQAQTDQDWPPT
jgi:hypothetical protein